MKNETVRVVEALNQLKKEYDKKKVEFVQKNGTLEKDKIIVDDGTAIIKSNKSTILSGLSDKKKFAVTR